MKKNAFTLVEMLIAMLLFAVIAVMLIPNVTQNAETNLFSTQIKKVQNDVQQAFLWIISENQGSMKTACSSMNMNDGRACIRNLIAGTTDSTNIPKKLESYCSFGGVETAEDSTTEIIARNDHKDNKRKDTSNPAKQHALYTARSPQFLNGDAASTGFIAGNIADDSNTYQAVYLKNGAYVSAVFDTTSGSVCNHSPENFVTGATGNINVCGFIEVDVNGGKIPNIVGKDIHYFWITEKDGIVPFGEMDNLTCGEVDANNSITTKPEKSNTKTEQLGCTARIIDMGKIDYY